MAHHVYTSCPEADDLPCSIHCPACAGTDEYCLTCDCPADDCELHDFDTCEDRSASQDAPGRTQTT
jgi:hypothetical protein